MTYASYAGVYAPSANFNDMVCPYNLISTYFDGWALGIYCALDATLSGKTAAAMYSDATMKALVTGSVQQYVCPFNEVCSYFGGADDGSANVLMKVGWSTVNTKVAAASFAAMEHPPY